MPSKATDRVFQIGLIVKGVDAVFEVVGGLLFTMPGKLARWILVLAQHEVYRHHDVLAGRLDRLAESVENRATLGQAIYLVVHGLAKVILISAIFRGAKWGYVGLIVVLTLFGLVEFGQAMLKGEWVVALLGLFDALLVYLIAKEYAAHFPKA